MNREDISALVQEQRSFFATGATLPINDRMEALKKLRAVLLENEAAIAKAVASDLGKSPEETYMCETGLVVSEITYLLRHLPSYARERTVPTPLAQFASRSYRKPCPYGVCLVMSPWNYPLLLTLEPLADALAAGNTAIVKPSAYSPATSALMKELLERTFPRHYVAVVEGGRAENACLLEEYFDYIFFTGGKTVGKLVLEKAAQHLTPVTLELGGKSPCVVDETAKLKLAARRIVFGKFLNCGQTCVAPDYILCHVSVKDELIRCLTAEIIRQYGDAPLGNPAYGKIVTDKHFHRVVGLIDSQKVAFGGAWDEGTRKIAPTILDNVTWDDAVMGQEIFGPVLPILSYEDLDTVIETVNSREKPLAMYIFSENRATIRTLTARCAYGGGCVNDCVIHLATSALPFGGVGESGMGSYHGKYGFDTFTHYKSIVDKKTWLDPPMRYQPYTKLYDWLIHRFLR